MGNDSNEVVAFDFGYKMSRKTGNYRFIKLLVITIKPQKKIRGTRTDDPTPPPARKFQGP